MTWLFIGLQYRVLISGMGCVYIFTRWHSWSFKRCLDCMYDLNVTIHY